MDKSDFLFIRPECLKAIDSVAERIRISGLVPLSRSVPQPHAAGATPRQVPAEWFAQPRMHGHMASDSPPLLNGRTHHHISQVDVLGACSDF